MSCFVSAQSHHAKQKLLTYSVTTHITGKGSLYWDYGKNMAFFLDKGYKTYNSACKIKNKSTYNFSKPFDRGIVVKPESGYYFDGFYDNTGKKANLTKTKISILRVCVDGTYYYDYFDAYDNPKFKNYTEKAYKEKVKSYLKKVYGTSRYKVMDSTILYEIPKKTATYTAKFELKKEPNVYYQSHITKTFGGRNFYVIPSKPSKYTYMFKSSSSKIIKVDKNTGYARIKGPGSATITCSVKETETTLAENFSIKIIVRPARVNSFSAVKKKNTLSLKWKKDNKNTGYEIQVSNNKKFSTILVSKTILGSSTTSTNLKLKTELFNNYARIRAFKVSNGNKIYGSYVITRIVIP